MGRAIEKQLENAGYRMFGENRSIEELIIAILKTENTRYLKAIPFLIRKYKPDIQKIYKISENKELCIAVLGITSQLFNEFHTGNTLPGYPQDKKLSKSLKLDYNEFKEEFILQLKNKEEPNLLLDKQKIYAERNLQMWLSQLFTKKEKYIMKRILNEEPVSRTDYEYYSRKTKKKLNSIIGLQDFAQTLQIKTPKYNSVLFRLKKLLEQWCSNELRTEVIIEEYRLFEDNLIIHARRKNGEFHDAVFKFAHIKNKEIIVLLKQYSEHDFT